MLQPTLHCLLHVSGREEWRDATLTGLGSSEHPGDLPISLESFGLAGGKVEVVRPRDVVDDVVEVLKMRLKGPLSDRAPRGLQWRE